MHNIIHAHMHRQTHLLVEQVVSSSFSVPHHLRKKIPKKGEKKPEKWYFASIPSTSTSLWIRDSFVGYWLQLWNKKFWNLWRAELIFSLHFRTPLGIIKMLFPFFIKNYLQHAAKRIFVYSMQWMRVERSKCMKAESVDFFCAAHPFQLPSEQ